MYNRNVGLSLFPAVQRFPLLACSSSIASNRALKLPAPKPCITTSITHTNTHAHTHTHLVVVSLDDLQEEGGSVLHGFGKDLQQVAIVVEIHQNTEPLQVIHVLLDRDLGSLEPPSQLCVVGVWDT